MSDTIVFGAAGFIGRFLVLELLREGREVVAAVRPGGRDRLTSWLAAQSVDTTGLTVADADITRPGLGLDQEFEDIRDVYNTAALMKFGLDADEARRVNVTAALEVARWASRRPGLRRLVHITGYRAAVDGGPENDYRRGAYEASKMEADAALRELADELGIALTIANPASVLGPGQYFGLSVIADNLWNGRLPALPGRRDSFVPVVEVDYVAKFLARLPELPETAGRAYTILDSATPDLPDLVRLLADHIHVPAPKFSIPVSVLRALPGAVTGVDPESLAFIAGDRYDTAAADAVARSIGLEHRPVGDVLRDWADGVVATRHGAVPERTGGFRDGLWYTGTANYPEYVLLHGLPLDSDSWAEVATALDAPVLAADLPGLGRSAPDVSDRWLDELMAPVRTRPVLVGHSLGTGAAIDFALRHPDRISRLVLIAPAFLQARAPWLLRSPLAAAVLKRLPTPKLAELLGVPDGPAVASAAANLRRPGVARRTVAALTAASTSRWRTERAEQLARVRVPVDIIVGSGDPLTVATERRVTTIDGAGHYPQVSHPTLVADLLAGRSAALASQREPATDRASATPPA
ncbi:alpha/beta fold hydrolase [Nocardia otitidiscaviarum]|uniref:Alpha/beta fold hydrolase n=1 Tax=Nocardia otitidiscaviarum TaxID=1823 RepID=A0A516NQ51_9NOCA|nr:alpha/beta fold hydrolase [Nocardia otitidiscaviarum]MCP9623679.1 alpha/beta fold hydrolase [Nocardia otitidiscaviarum]QDP81019.1 alpha/beta fold hydrolase [Nocardia otitidiscaviarum]